MPRNFGKPVKICFLPFYSLNSIEKFLEVTVLSLLREADEDNVDMLLRTVESIPWVSLASREFDVQYFRILVLTKVLGF